ncbi:MAG: response regulator [Lachnospiraceae bacterium]|nr:response regulator [Lachnospiraceae bacterium]
MKSIQTRISIVIAVITLIATGTLMVTAMVRSRRLLDSNSNEIILSAEEYYAAELDDHFNSSEQSVDSICNYAMKRAEAYPGFFNDEAQRTAYTEDISELSKSIAENTRGAMSVYLRYDPDTFGPTAGFFYTKDPATGEWHTEAPTDMSLYDKDDVEHVGWYYIPISKGEPVWMDPYYNKNIDVSMISYIIPYSLDGKIVGVIGMDIDLEMLREEVAGIQLRPYSISRPILMKKDGNIIYHYNYPNGADIDEMPDADRTFFSTVYNMERDKVTWYRTLIKNMPAKIVTTELKNGMILGIEVSRAIIGRPQAILVATLFLTSIVIVIISVWAGIMWVKSIITPLKKMTEVADRYAEGDYSEKMSVDSKDEVGRLSRSLETMSESLVRQIELADAANKAKSTFLSNMSHEIRTPITAVLGLNEMILRDSDDKEILTYSENIKNAGNTLLGIINDILDFSKIEAGKIEIVPVDYDLSSVINDLVNMTRVRADEKGLSLKLDFDRDIPKMLNGDEVRIKQIITNILSNAVKYTEKGTVTFTMGFKKCEDDPDGVFINVAVEDTGIGIKEEDMKKLFSEFERIDEKRNRNIEGTGLGMNITRSLLDMMGSALEVKSTYGEGSVFSFSLKQKVVKWEPLGDYKESFSTDIYSRSGYRSAFTAAGARVLMVDDNEMNLLVFKSLVKQTLVKVDTALSGAEGLSLSGDKKYDIIFLDHMMPGMDGVETLHEMKKMHDSPNDDTPIICITANAISGAREEYINEGFDDYITKPIDPERLEAMMMEYLPKDKLDKSDGVVLEFSAGGDDEAADNGLDEGAYGEDDFDLSALKDQDIIDVEKGMMHCGGRDVYVDILKTFYEDGDEPLKKLDEYFTDGDMDSYVIKIHSLKSSARTLGAASLGDIAGSLEKAGKENDKEFISDNTEELKSEHARVMEVLGGVFG